jgi:hypothetical protein
VTEKIVLISPYNIDCREGAYLLEILSYNIGRRGDIPVEVTESKKLISL